MWPPHERTPYRVPQFIRKVIAMRTNPRWGAKHCGGFAVLLIALMPIHSSDLLAADEPVPGMLSLSCEHSLVTFPEGCRAVVFDTNTATGEGVDLGDGLIVDSIRNAEGTIEVENVSQIDGLRISLDEFRQLLASAKVREMSRVAPNRRPHDTLAINPNTGDTTVVSDASKFYTLMFPTSLNLDSLMGLFEEVDGVNWVVGEYRRYSD